MKNITRKIFLTLLLLTPFIELLNASFVRNNVILGNIGQLFKGLIIILALFVLTRKQKSLYLGALAIGGVLSIIHHFITPSHSFSYLVNDLLFVIKVTYIIPLSFILSDISRRYILIASSVTWVTIVVNIVIGTFGAGYTQYALGYGYKGFFFSGNEMALTLVMTSAVILFLLYEQRKLNLAITFSIILLILGPLQGMKTVIIGLPLLAIVIPIIFYKAQIRERIAKLSLARNISLFAAIIGIMFTATAVLYSISPEFFQRFGEITARSGIIGAILSERDKYLEYGLKLYKTEYSLPQKIFGAGYSLAQNRMVKFIGDPKTIEIDFFDLFFTFGVVAFIYYGAWSIFIYSSAKKHDIPSRFITFVNIIFFVLSLLTGHVVYSTFLITYWALINGLSKNKPETTVYFLGSTSPGGISTYMQETAKNATDVSITILPSQVSGGIYNTVFAFVKSYFVLLYSLIVNPLKNRRSVIHLHMATNGSFIRKALVVFKLSWFADQTIVHLHSGETVPFFKKILGLPIGKQLLSAFFALTSDIIVVSETLSKEIMTFFNENQLQIVNEKWHILNNAIVVPEKLAAPRNYKLGDTLEIVTVSRLNKVKNLTVLPKIAALLKKYSVKFRLTIVGDGPDKQHIQEAIVKENVTDVVNMVGHISHDLVGEYYNSAHLFLLPSKHESFGIVVLEAYLYGLPAITSDVGGLKDVVIQGETGMRCEYNDAQTFAANILELSKDPKKLSRMAKNTQELVRHFDYEKHIQQLRQIYGMN